MKEMNELLGNDIRRRKFLGAAGTAIAGGLAGCSGSDNGDSSGEAGTGTSSGSEGGSSASGDDSTSGDQGDTVTQDNTPDALVAEIVGES